MKTNKTKLTIKKVVYTALFAALTFVATVVIHIHIPIPGAVGYINFGDCFVLLSGVLLGPIYGGLAAGIGSALADALYGYWLYVPATFVIKAVMAVVCCFIYRSLSKKKDSYKIIPLSLGAILGEIIMVGGYFLYESILYTFATAMLGVVPNCTQGVAGAFIFVIIVQLMNKTKLINLIKL